MRQGSGMKPPYGARLYGGLSFGIVLPMEVPGRASLTPDSVILPYSAHLLDAQ